MKGWRIRFSPFAALALVGVLFYQAYVISGPTGLGTVNRLQAELEEQLAENEAIGQLNRELEAELDRMDDAAASTEELARYHFGLIKPGEVFVHVEPDSR